MSVRIYCENKSCITHNNNSFFNFLQNSALQMEELDIQSMIRMTLKCWLDLQHFCSRFYFLVLWNGLQKMGSEMNEEKMTN